jgi:hypothetical protein
MNEIEKRRKEMEETSDEIEALLRGYTFSEAMGIFETIKLSLYGTLLAKSRKVCEQKT